MYNFFYIFVSITKEKLRSKIVIWNCYSIKILMNNACNFLNLLYRSGFTDEHSQRNYQKVLCRPISQNPS